MRDFSFSLLILVTALSVGCSGSDFASGSASRAAGKKDGSSESDKDRNKNKGKGSKDGGTDEDIEADGEDDGNEGDGLGSDDDGENGNKVDEDIAGLDDEEISTTDGSVKAGRCSPDYTVGGQSNIFLAGTPDGTSISYKKGKPDLAPNQQPLLVVPQVQKCFRAGAKLYFKVSGQISHGSNPATNADGRLDGIHNHERGAIFGKSDIRAPLNALVAVFLGDGDPSSLPAPGTLSFGTQAERDYKELSPKAGQVFFIGDGKNSAGEYQKVVVPEGVTRLYFGIMDVFEWNNNSGSLTGAILIEK